MKSLFTFSKSQKIGVVSIIIVIFLQIVILNKGNAIGVPDPFVINKSDYLIEEGKSYYSKNQEEASEPSYVLHNFDPNLNSIQDWIGIGFSDKQAKTIISYKTKIGGFKKKEELKKVFVISSDKYDELEPFMNIETKAITSHIKSSTDEVIMELVELNSATVDQLINIKGVGEYTANGIIKYKEFLGGFHSVDQLKEVYGISLENFQIIEPQVVIVSSQVVKLNVNELSRPDLIKHPYINWTIANRIIDKRLITKLSSIEFLIGDEYFNQEEYNNLLPYITYE